MPRLPLLTHGFSILSVGNTIEISVNTDDSFISHSWSEVSRLGITVRFNDQDADRNAVAPPTEQLADKLALNGFSLCGCVAKRKYQTYIIGKPKDVNFKLQQLVSGLRKAWSRANPGNEPNVLMTTALYLFPCNKDKLTRISMLP